MSFYIVLIAVSIAAFMTVLAHKLTIIAAVTGVVVSMFIFMGAGYTGLILLAAFFILGTLATSFKIKQKESLAIAETNKGKRNAGQVLANGGVAAILGLLAWVFPQYSTLLGVMMAAGFASATADTLSSELGNVYGKKFYNILSFKKDIRGEDGVISLEGTLCGLAGSILIAVIYAVGFGWNACFIYIIIAGTIGNLFDSVLGATLERKGAIGNNTVNFLNTLVAALAAWLMMQMDSIL
ncbi:MAG: DUF92 domain-containing protein [Bacteroidota bacterium]